MQTQTAEVINHETEVEEFFFANLITEALDNGYLDAVECGCTPLVDNLDDEAFFQELFKLADAENN